MASIKKADLKCCGNSEHNRGILRAAIICEEEMKPPDLFRTCPKWEYDKIPARYRRFSNDD